MQNQTPKITPIHPSVVSELDSLGEPELAQPKAASLSRRTFGMRHPSRRTFGMRHPSRRTFGMRHP